MDAMGFPETLLEAITYFADPDVAIAFVRDMRWPDGVECPTCGSKDVWYLAAQRRWKCKSNHPKKQFSVKVGTIFEDSPVGLDKWLPAVWLVTGCKNGVSSYEIARDLGVTQKTAWFLMHRVRLAMQAKSFDKLSGEIEADETFIGGKAKNMHKDVRKRRITRKASQDKTIVLGLLERDGQIRAMVAPDRYRATVEKHIRENVEAGSNLYTDEFVGYWSVKEDYVHQIINHAERYVNGRVHTNGMENFWSLLKRTLSGTYVSIDPIHLSRYLDEQMFRFNQRHLTDQERFLIVIAQVTGRRITYKQLTGKAETETLQS